MALFIDHFKKNIHNVDDAMKFCSKAAIFALLGETRHANSRTMEKLHQAQQNYLAFIKELEPLMLARFPSECESILRFLKEHDVISLIGDQNQLWAYKTYVESLDGT